MITVAAAGQAVLIRRQYQALDPRLQDHLLLEPSARNTAAAVALASLHAEAVFGGDAVLWVCPSDHLMLDQEALYAALRPAVAAAADGWLVTFGITPSRPETGFGWIAPAEPLRRCAGGAAGAIASSRSRTGNVAESLLATGTHLWNSGMFVFQARPDAGRAGALGARHPGGDAGRLPGAGERAERRPRCSRYAKIRSQPIDKAVMEQSTHVAVVPADPQWSDVGSWHAIWELMDKDEHGQRAPGRYDRGPDAHDNLIRSEKRLVALAGVSGLAVIETADALLVVDRQNSDAVRGVVDALAKPTVARR